MKKSYLPAFAGLGLALSGSAQVLHKVPLSEEYGYFYVEHISEEGNYLSGYATNTGQPVISQWKQEATTVYSPTGTSMPWVNNNGEGVGYSNNSGLLINFNSNDITELDPRGADGSFVRCFAVSETVGGNNIIAGVVYDADWKERACYWENGERNLLPEPTPEVVGFEFEGSHASLITADGSLIVGYLCTMPVLEPMVIWERQENGSYICNPVCKDWMCIEAADPDEAPKPFKKFSPGAVSADGRYIAVNLRDYYDDFNWPIQKIGRYDVQEGVLAVYDSNSDWGDYIATGIANDGTIVGMVGGLDNAGLIAYPNSLYVELMQNVFPDITEFYYYDFFGQHMVAGISANGRYIAGVGPVISEETTYPAYQEAYVLDTEGEASVSSITTGKISKEEYYTIDGRILAAPVPGLNIIRGSDGVARKVMISK